MTPTKLLTGQFLIAHAIMALGFGAAIQWAATMLGYQLGLRSWLLGDGHSGGTGHRACFSRPASFPEAIVHLRRHDVDVAL